MHMKLIRNEVGSYDITPRRSLLSFGNGDPGNTEQKKKNPINVAYTKLGSCEVIINP